MTTKHQEQLVRLGMLMALHAAGMDKNKIADRIKETT